MLLSIYYNPNHNSTYYRICDYLQLMIYDDKYYVGYTNMFDHTIIQMFVINEYGFFNVSDNKDYQEQKRNKLRDNKRCKKSFINRLFGKE